MKKISLSQWSSVAEIIGMAAVVISLIFVGFEIKQNTNQMQVNALSTSINAMRSVTKLTATREKAEYILRGMENFEKLSAVERAIFESDMQTVIMDFEVAYKQYQLGFLKDEEYKGFESVMSGILRSPGVNQYYGYSKEFLPPYLNQEFERIIRDYANETTFLEYLRFGTISTPPTSLQQPTNKTDRLTGLITFAFYKDVEAAEKFYVDIMGLKKSYHRPITRVFQVNDGAAIGLMDVSASPDTKIDNKDMGFSFIVEETADVDRWYEYLKSKNVNIYAPPSNGTRTPVRSVHFYDTEGYDIEIFAWLADAQMIKE
ncbi:MAG: VOC family protein [Emcibacteraceae bacterium]|nr:VOC family protein [Emcibacteraceae bacterium]MDG1994901.1 VOC family protein [Emcibacteraceae bacterium]